MTKSSEYFLFGAHRAAVPLEHLMALGFSPDVVLQDLTAAKIRALAGEAMALPTVASVTVSLWQAMRMWTEGQV